MYEKSVSAIKAEAQAGTECEQVISTRACNSPPFPFFKTQARHLQFFPWAATTFTIDRVLDSLTPPGQQIELDCTSKEPGRHSYDPAAFDEFQSASGFDSNNAGESQRAMPKSDIKRLKGTLFSNPCNLLHRVR